MHTNPKKQNPPRRHGDTEKIKTNFDHTFAALSAGSGHRGARRRTGNQKLDAEGAEEDQSNKFAQKTKRFAISNTEKIKIFLASLIFG